MKPCYGKCYRCAGRFNGGCSEWNGMGGNRMTGYKVFNPDFTCRGFKYEVGKTYKHDGPLSICHSGFHFCREVADCFNYYSFDPKNKVAEIEATGLVESDGDKSVTNEITIVREIPWEEMLAIANTGKGCTGLKNTGDRNTGNWNTGDWNTGDWNTGDCNTGNRNTGNWNTGNRNTGFFSTITPKVTLFEKPVDMTCGDVCEIPGIQILNWNYENNWWIYSQNMTEEEKTAHPEHETLGGYLKSIPFKDACALMWGNLTKEEKEMVKAIPNFDADIFYRITGIEVKTE